LLSSPVIGIDGAQGVAVAGEVELDRSRGVLEALDIDLALTESLESFQSVVALWTVSCEIGVERGDPLQERGLQLRHPKNF
jgi:hypothetical protein